VKRSALLKDKDMAGIHERKKNIEDGVPFKGEGM